MIQAQVHYMYYVRYDIGHELDPYNELLGQKKNYHTTRPSKQNTLKGDIR